MDLMRPHAAAIEEKVSSGCFFLSAGVTRVRSGDGAVGWELEGRQEAGMKSRIHPQHCIRSFTQCLPSAYHTPGSGTIHTKLGLLANSPYVQTHSSSIHVCTGVKAYTLMFTCTYTHKSKSKSFQKVKGASMCGKKAKQRADTADRLFHPRSLRLYTHLLHRPARISLVLGAALTTWAQQTLGSSSFC